MVMKYARAYRENSVSVVGHANGTIPPDSVNETCLFLQHMFRDGTFSV
jgi:hypothetical protein